MVFVEELFECTCPGSIAHSFMRLLPFPLLTWCEPLTFGTVEPCRLTSHALAQVSLE